MSTCYICREPTDLALTDVLTPTQVESLARYTTKIPLIGTCGRDNCVVRCIEHIIYNALEEKELV